MSHPLWVCGLKFFYVRVHAGKQVVTPFMGVWIEIWNEANEIAMKVVTPFMGVWIEIFSDRETLKKEKSHPLWVCGLKFCFPSQQITHSSVTPFMGVWIEINNRYYCVINLYSHTLYGCVD